MSSPSPHAESISEGQKRVPISVPLPISNMPLEHRIAEEHHKEKPIYPRQALPT